MHAIVLSAYKMNGLSKASNSPFEMHKLTILVPAENVSSQKFNKLAYGYEVLDLDIEPASFPKFSVLTYPCAVTINLEQLPRGGKLQSVVTGYSGQPAYIDVKPPVKA